VYRIGSSENPQNNQGGIKLIFEKAKKIVGKRLGDLDLQLYRDIVGGFIIQSICDLAVLPETRIEEIKGLAVNASVTISGDIDLSSYDMLAFRDIYARINEGQISAAIKVKFTELSQDIFGLIGTDEQVVPASNEIFFCRYYDKIQFYKESKAIGKHIYLLYIKEPDDYKDDYNLNNVMSIGFQYKVIDLAVQKVRQHLGAKDAVSSD